MWGGELCLAERCGLDLHTWIRPEFGIEAPLSLVLPVEEVSDDDVQWDLASPMLTRHFEQLLLVPVAEFALPEAQSVLRHHGNTAGHPTVGLFDLGGGVARNNPVIQ